MSTATILRLVGSMLYLSSLLPKLLSCHNSGKKTVGERDVGTGPIISDGQIIESAIKWKNKKFDKRIHGSMTNLFRDGVSIAVPNVLNDGEIR
jgi:hypothetical protein